MSTARTAEPAGAGAWGAREAAVRLMRAATRSGAHLVSEAAAMIEGWAVLADPIAGAVYATPASAAAAGVRAVAHPQEHPTCQLHPAAGAVLVLAPGPAVAAARTGLVAQVTVALLEVRAQRAAELRAEQVRLHSTLIRLLLDGHTASVTATVGGGEHGLTHATVYRVTGPDIPTAHQVLWRAVSPTLAPGRSVYVLLGQLEGELVVVELHGGAPDDGRLLRLVSRVTERHGLLAGLAGPVPLDEVGAAYADAAVARHSASPARRIVPATAVGASGLAQLLPADPYTGWAAAVLKPLTPDHRHLLTVWLRTGSIPCTATTLGISAGTVRARLRETGRLLRTDLADAGIRAHLLLALRAPTPGKDAPLRAGRVSLRVLPYGILDTQAARTWAAGLLDGLDAHLRIAFACWLRHHAKTAPAANELHVHRTTLTLWLVQAAEQLGLHLDDATTRAELHLALEATAPDGGDDPARLPRRGGRTYRQP